VKYQFTEELGSPHNVRKRSSLWNLTVEAIKGPNRGSFFWEVLKRKASVKPPFSFFPIFVTITSDESNLRTTVCTILQESILTLRNVQYCRNVWSWNEAGLRELSRLEPILIPPGRCKKPWQVVKDVFRKLPRACKYWRDDGEAFAFSPWTKGTGIKQLVKCWKRILKQVYFYGNGDWLLMATVPALDR
jgi:hypothetical protein